MTSCTLKDIYIKYIQSGTKTKEARMAIPMFQKWKVDDEVKFFSRNNPKLFVNIKIKKISHYKTIRDMITNEDYVCLVPNAESIESAIQLYLNIPGYMEKEKQFGVVLFDIELLKLHR